MREELPFAKEHQNQPHEKSLIDIIIDLLVLLLDVIASLSFFNGFLPLAASLQKLSKKMSEIEDGGYGFNSKVVNDRRGK